MSYTFQPPTVQDVPNFLPDDTPEVKENRGHYALGVRGVNVFKLADGTYVQDTPTAENSNSSVPYPILWGQPISVSWYKGQPTYTYQDNPVILIYYGGRTYTVSDAEANSLANAGYTVTPA